MTRDIIIRPSRLCPGCNRVLRLTRDQRWPTHNRVKSALWKRDRCPRSGCFQS